MAGVTSHLISKPRMILQPWAMVFAKSTSVRATNRESTGSKSSATAPRRRVGMPARRRKFAPNMLELSSNFYFKWYEGVRIRLSTS